MGTNNLANYKGIKIDGVYREGKVLEEYASRIIRQKETPRWKTEIFTFIMEWLDEGRTVTAHTSGSTGKPKQIVLSKEAMIASAHKTNHFFRLNGDCVALLCLSAGYIAGKMMIVRAFVGGFNLQIQEPSSEPLKEINRKIDFVAMVPMQVNNSFNDFKDASCKNAYVIIGGGVLSTEIKAKLFKLPVRFYETYGMTETVSHVALKSISDEYFQAMEGVSFDLDDRGCLVIKGRDIVKKELVTNDIVVLKDNRHFKWEGRFDNVINSGGVKIMPEKVEAKLRTLLKVPLYVSAVSDVELGERLILVLEKENEGVIDLSFLKQNTDLSKYEIPKEIRYVSEFPKVNNKIDRKNLKTMVSHFMK